MKAILRIEHDHGPRKIFGTQEGLEGPESCIVERVLRSRLRNEIREACVIISFEAIRVARPTTEATK